MATTINPVTLNYDTWTAISSATVQSIQVRSGGIALIFAGAQPAPGAASDDKAHIIYTNQMFTTTTGGQSWGRALNQTTKTAIVAVTED